MKFQDKLSSSFGVRLIVAGLTHLVDDEDHTPREAFQVLEEVKRNTFHALLEIKREGESHDN